VKAQSPVRIALVALMVFTLSVAITLFLFIGRPLWLFHRQDFKTGNEIVTRVESFRKSHGHLPETLTEAGMDEDDLHVFYPQNE
jgi:hypothetical protein